MGLKLYEIVEELLKLEKTWVDFETGEINVELEKQLEQTKIDFDTKMENIWKILKNYDSEIKAIKAEVDRLNKRKKTLENTYERLKNYAAQGLEYGKKWMSKSGVAVYSWRKSSKLDIYNEKLIDEKYIIVTQRPDSIMIKNAIKSGEDIAGVKLIEGQNLQIK